MMQAASELLAKGNALALFPEGTSHSDTTLKRFRSGAARIALSARVLGRQQVRIVPAALYYEKKQNFRSRAVLALGEPLDVPFVELDQAGEPSRETGNALTSEIRNSIEKIMPTADTAEALVMAERAERILSAAVRDSPEECKDAIVALLAPGTDSDKLTLADRMARRRHLLDTYGRLAAVAPREIEELISTIARLGDELEAVGLPIDAAPGSAHAESRKMYLLLLGAALSPIALVGLAVHAPAYQMVRHIAFRYSKGQADVTATVKLLAGLLLFPLTWTVVGLSIGWVFGALWGLFAATAGSLVGWITIVATEIWGSVARTWGTSVRARRAGIDWSSIVKRRAHVAREMARLTNQR